MKSLVIALIAGLGFLTAPLDSPEVIKTIMVGAEVGAPSQSCSGVGLCVIIDLSVKEFKIIERQVFGEISIGRGAAVTSIKIFDEFMTDDTRKEMFSGDSFIMTDAYKGRLKMGNENGDGSIYIAAGEHPMKKIKDGYLITFRQ